jgi:hypothetical protein
MLPTVKTQPTFSKTTLQLIKKYLSKAKKYRRTLTTVRGDVFVYGFEGGNFDNAYTQKERNSLNHAFSTVEEIFDYCDSLDFDDVNSNSIQKLKILVSFFYREKLENNRYSHRELLEQAFDVTKFWKYLFNNEPDYIAEIIGALNLYEWIEALCCEVGIWSAVERTNA